MNCEKLGQTDVILVNYEGFMMKNSMKLVTGLFTCILIQVLSIGSATASPANMLMQELDKDEDGFISLKEAVQHIELLRNFGLIDDDEDGKLTAQELAMSSLTPRVTSGASKVAVAQEN